MRENKLLVGINIDPSAATTDLAFQLAELADADYDLIAVQDHPYNPAFLDTWTLLTALAMRTKRVAFTPNVANLGLRSPAMLYRAATSLQVLSGGRVILGVGAGASEAAVTRFGGPRLESARAMGDAFAEALAVLARLQRATPAPVSVGGIYHRLERAQFGPLPAVPVPIWVGAVRDRGLRLTGTYTDGWLCPLNVYVPPPMVAERQQAIDTAATAAGRDPRTVRRMYNVIGMVTPGGAGSETPGRPLVGPPQFWVDRLSAYVNELGFDGFIFWPAQQPKDQAELFASVEVTDWVFDMQDGHLVPLFFR